MNHAAAHRVTNVAAWVEHEETIAISLLKKALRLIECKAEAIITAGLLGVCILGVVVRLNQLSQYAQLIYCFD